MSQTSIEDFADELYEIIETELDGVAAFRPAQIEALAEAITGLKNVKAKSVVYAFNRIGTVDMTARAKIDGVTARYHVYSTKSEVTKKVTNLVTQINVTQNMVNKRLAIG
jgi:hypothetical protein